MLFRIEQILIVPELVSSIAASDLPEENQMFRKALLAVVILFPIQSCMKEAHDNNDHKETISTLIYNVQFAAVRACSFLPAAQSIGALIAVAYPPSAAAGQIAEAICSAVKQAPVARGASTLSLSVNGVPVSGKLIQ